MPDHAHIIVAPRVPNLEIGRFQGDLKEQVARNAINWLKGNFPDWLSNITVTEGKRIRRRFWQPGGGYDRNIVHLHSLQGMIDYIHMNPVRSGLVEKAVDWEWSSARWYAGLLPVFIEIDRTIPSL